MALLPGMSTEDLSHRGAQFVPRARGCLPDPVCVPSPRARVWQVGFEPESVSQGTPSMVGGEGPLLGRDRLSCVPPARSPAEAALQEAVGVGAVHPHPSGLSPTA